MSFIRSIVHVLHESCCCQLADSPNRRKIRLAVSCDAFSGTYLASSLQNDDAAIDRMISKRGMGRSGTLHNLSRH